MQIRPATPDDVPAVLPMVRRIAAFHEQLDPAKYGMRDDPGKKYDRWLRDRANDPRSVFLVADVGPDDQSSPGRRLAGFLIATVTDEIPIYRVKEIGFIHDLWVEERYRHEGIARQMTMLAIQRFREIGVPQVRLDTAADNEAARELFRKCGFRASAVEMLLELK